MSGVTLVSERDEIDKLREECSRLEAAYERLGRKLNDARSTLREKMLAANLMYFVTSTDVFDQVEVLEADSLDDALKEARYINDDDTDGFPSRWVVRIAGPDGFLREYSPNAGGWEYEHIDGRWVSVTSEESAQQMAEYLGTSWRKQA